MKTKITIVAATAFWWITGAFAQTPCSNDLNGFVSYKNVGGTGSYQLNIGFEEKASQTYNYSGPGKITSARVYGSYPGTALGGVPLRIGVYNVDASGKPTTAITTVNQTWWGFINNTTGYLDATFPNGVTVNNRFAITVEVLSAYPFGSSFNLQYTGNGEGGNQDLASLAGTSTGFNWTSAKNSFNKDGDFYLVPNMAHLNVPGFTTPSSCYNTNSAVLFSNTTQMTTDSMFNKIGFPNYTGTNKLYSWNFGDGSPLSYAMNPTHSYATGGIYVVTLTTKIEGWNNTCTKTFTKSLSIGLTANATAISNVSCNGASTGSFVANGQFGAPSYSYNINNGIWQTSQNFTGLYANSMTLYVKDSKGCVSSVPVSIGQPAGIVFGAAVTGNATCGGSNGSIASSASGGVSPLQFKLDNGSLQSSANFSNLPAATHTLMVIDANGCSKSTLIIVNDLGGPTINMPNTTNVSCYNGNDGSITLSSNGGTGLIQYSINGGLTFQAGNVFSNVSAGTYACVVKDNAGCTDITNVIISQGQAISITGSSSPALCNGASNGQITVSSTGGTGIHNYSINGINYQSGNVFSGLAAGTYTAYAKDVTGCIKTITLGVTQPNPIAIVLTATAALCSGAPNGAISAVPSGGNGNYSFSINGGPFQGTGDFFNLNAGAYTITVKDSYNCSNTTGVIVNQPAPITTTVNTTNSTCGFSNGSVLVLAAGGSSSGFQYSINGGTSFTSSGLFSNLAAGTQYIIVKDGTNCQVIVSGTIIDSNGPTITNSTQQNVSCNGNNDGSITINTVSGGTGLLQYSKNGINWQNSPIFVGLQAGTYVIQVKDANGCVGNITKTITQPNAFLISNVTSSVACYGAATGAATISASGGAGFLAYSINNGFSYQSGTVFNNLQAASYNVIIKDAANCMAFTSFNIIQPSQIDVFAGILNVTCSGSNNGAINLSALGGHAPYMYSLNGGAFSSISNFTGLAGNSSYVFYVRDVTNCIVADTYYISEPAPVSVQQIINNISCAGGNNGLINLLVSGGIAPYSYNWSNGSTIQSIFNLTAGMYSVTIQDFNGCTSIRSYTLTQPLNPLVVNGVVIAASSVNSGDGSINVTVTGGVAPYSFSWSNGATSEDISNLNPGTYVLTIIDANGCATSSSFIVSNITGIANIQIGASAVTIAPNPANEYANVEAIGLSISKIELVNLLGQKVFENEVNDSIAKINTTQLVNGTYFVKVYFTNNNNTVTKKIVVSK